MQHAAQPEQTQQHQLVEQEVGYHCVAPFHGGETGALYPFCRLRNYPHAGGTRPPSCITQLVVITIASYPDLSSTGQCEEAKRCTPCGHSGERKSRAIVSSPPTSSIGWWTVSLSSSYP